MANNTQATGEGETPKTGQAKKIWPTVGFSVLIIVLVGVAVFALLKYEHRKHLPSLSSAERSAATASSGGRYQQALSDLQAVVSEAKTTQQKEQLYALLAPAAQNAGQLKLAINYYVLKHQLDPSTEATDSYLLANLYQQSNDYAQAISQYKLYITYLQQHPSLSAPYSISDEVTPINATIQSLQAKETQR